jgi:hypothetical protein
LGIVTESGDTLTLVDRANHHFTTAISTVEIASQNAAKLLSEYQKFYYNTTNNGVGEYKSYVVKYNEEDAQRIQALKDLLHKNQIKFGTAKASGSFRGYNYDLGKTESFNVAANDLIIPSQQAKSALVKVLFEPNTKFVDSIAYDITAWSLPYVYGVKTYGSPQRIDLNASDVTDPVVNNTTEATYAYVIRWNGMQTVKLVSQLLQKGIKLRFNERPFEAGGQSFERGAVLVLKTSNQYYHNLWGTVRELANTYHVQLTPVSTGFVDKGNDFGSSKVHPLKSRRVAVFTGEGIDYTNAGEIWFYFDQLINYPVTLINASDFNRTSLKDYDVLIMPSGNYRFLNDKNSVDQLKSWVGGGGNLIAVQDAVAQLAKQEWSIRSKKLDDSDSNDIYAPLKTFEARDRDFIPNTIPGSIFKVELDNTHPLAFGYPKYYYTLKQDDNIYDFIKEDGWNVGVIKKKNQVSGFVGSHLQKKLEDGMLFGVQELGRGTITYLADDLIFRSFWENGKLMFANAVFLVGQ